jgi:hypothetical protein
MPIKPILKNEKFLRTIRAGSLDNCVALKAQNE